MSAALAAYTVFLKLQSHISKEFHFSTVWKGESFRSLLFQLPLGLIFLTQYGTVSCAMYASIIILWDFNGRYQWLNHTVQTVTFNKVPYAGRGEMQGI